MNKLKLGKRPHLTVCWYGRDGQTPTPGYDGGSPIYTERLCFRYRFPHKKGSRYPVGYYHDGYGNDDTVEVRWLWTVEHEFFAPEVTFRPGRLGLKAVAKIAKALEKLGRDSQPEALCEALQAMLVEQVEVAGHFRDDYRSVRLPGEPAMVTIARAAL
jgi:hypothetical protein